MWEDLDRFEIPARTADEPRFLVVAKTGGKHWSRRVHLPGSATRIKSVRRARKEEIAIYEN